MTPGTAMASPTATGRQVLVPTIPVMAIPVMAIPDMAILVMAIPGTRTRTRLTTDGARTGRTAACERRATRAQGRRPAPGPIRGRPRTAGSRLMLGARPTPGRQTRGWRLVPVSQTRGWRLVPD